MYAVSCGFDRAIARGSLRVNTPCSNVSASLVRVTRADHLRVGARRALRFADFALVAMTGSRWLQASSARIAYWVIGYQSIAVRAVGC